MSDTDSQEDTVENTPPKKRKYSSFYNKDWEREDNFKNWLKKSSKGKFFA